MAWFKKLRGAGNEWLPLPCEESIRLHAQLGPAAPLHELRDWRGALVGFSHQAPEPVVPRLPRGSGRLRRFRATVDLDQANSLCRGVLADLEKLLGAYAAEKRPF